MADSSGYNAPVTVAKRNRVAKPDLRVVRVVLATEADLSSTQRALADEHGMTPDQRDEFAFAISVKSSRVRNAGETEEAFALHERRRRALRLARYLVLALDESSNDDAPAMLKNIEALEAAERRMVGRTDGEKASLVREVIRRLDQASTRYKAGKDLRWDAAMGAGWIATSAYPELARITEAAWMKAIEAWQGYKRPARGGGKDRSQRYDGARVLFELLSPFGLTDVSGSKNKSAVSAFADFITREMRPRR